MIELTEEQHDQVARSGDEPVTIIDPHTQIVYVLVRKDIYDRISATLDDDDARHYAALLEKLDPEDWEDASNYDHIK